MRNSSQSNCYFTGQLSLLSLIPVLLVAGCASETGIRQNGFVEVFIACAEREIDVPQCMTNSSYYKNFDLDQKAAIRDMSSIYFSYKSGSISLLEFQQRTKNTLSYYNRRSVYAAQQSNCRSAALIGAIGGTLASSSATLGGAISDGAAVGNSSSC